MQQNKSIRSQLSRSSAYVFLGKSVRYSLQYGTQILLINLLLPSDFGLMRYVTLFVGMASLINEMGLTTAIVQKQDISREEITGCFTASMIWGVLLYLLIYSLAPFTASFFGNSELVNLLRAGSLIVPLSSVCSVPRALLQRQMRFGALASIEASSAVVSSSLMVFMAVKGYGTWSLVTGALVQEVIALMLLAFSVRVPGVHLNALMNSGKILKVGFSLVFLRIADYLRFSMPFVIVGKLIDEKMLGLFSFSYDISVLPHLVINAILGSITVAIFSRLQNDKSRTESGFSQLTFVVSSLAIPILFSMSVLSEEIVSTICFFRNNTIWLESAVLMRWLTLMGVFYCISAFPGTIWISNKRIIPSILWSLAMLLTTVVAIYSAVKWGAEGIAVAMFIRAAVVFPIFTHVNYRITGIRKKVYFRSIYPAFAGSLLMIIPIITIQRLTPGTSLIRNISVLLVSALSGGTVYVICLRLFSGSLFTPFTEVLDHLKQRIFLFNR